VLRTAPENLAALRGLAEVHNRKGQLREALGFYESALGLAKYDPELEEAIARISRTLAAEEPAPNPVRSVKETTAEFVSALEALPSPEEPAPVKTAELERFLDAIHTYRHRGSV